MFLWRDRTNDAPARGAAAALLLALVGCASLGPTRGLAAPLQGSGAALPVAGERGDSTRYDEEYPVIGYSEAATRNPVARLQERLARGELRLEYEPPRGYLDSILDALGIDASSQTLVYSKTSLQVALIDARTPRAIYFHDDTYVAWVPGSAVLEIATMDGALGPVFYTLANDSPAELRFERVTSRCLTCHDTYGMAGGGVPQFQFLSTLVDTAGDELTPNASTETTDRTPISERWGGWYVSGRQGEQEHLGNISAPPGTDPKHLRGLMRGNLDTLRGLVDLEKYRADTSDIVALLVFDHQVFVDNLITRANFKSRAAIARLGLDADSGWSSLPTDLREALKRLLDPLVEAMLLVDAAKFTDRIASTSGFDVWFQSQGPHDSQGRSLRTLDLRTRLFKYRLSYLVYSAGFDGLPPYDLDYLYTRFADVLSGRDRRPPFADFSAQERRDALEILTATKPAFAAAAAKRAAECARGACEASAGLSAKRVLGWLLVGLASLAAFTIFGWAARGRR